MTQPDDTLRRIASPLDQDIADLDSYRAARRLLRIHNAFGLGAALSGAVLLSAWSADIASATVQAHLTFVMAFVFAFLSIAPLVSAIACGMLFTEYYDTYALNDARKLVAKHQPTSPYRFRRLRNTYYGY